MILFNVELTVDENNELLKIKKKAAVFFVLMLVAIIAILFYLFLIKNE